MDRRSTSIVSRGLWFSLSRRLLCLAGAACWIGLQSAGSAQAAQNIAEADLMGVRLGMPAAQVEAVVADRFPSAPVQRTYRELSGSVSAAPETKYLRRLTVEFAGEKTLSIVFAAPPQADQTVEVSLTEHAPQRSARALLNDIVGRFGKPGAVRWIKRDQVIATWGAGIGHEGEAAPHADAEATLRFEVIPHVSSNVTLVRVRPSFRP